MTVPENPFAGWQSGVVVPGQPTPLLLLVQMAIGGTVDDQIPDHVLSMFAVLEDRGDEAWRQAGLILTQHVLCGGVR